MTKKISTAWWMILGFALFKLLIHLLTNTHYELHRDAFLYYSLGQHLDWGYFSVPPLIGLLAKTSVWLFGETIFALRFFPAIVGSLSVVLIGKMVKDLKGGTWALIIALLAFVLSPAFLRSNTLFQPVSFNQFFWLLSAYLVLKLIITQHPKFWIPVFLVFGVAFLNKYSIAFFMLAFLLAMLLTPHRRLFLSRYFLMGGFAGLIIILPNLIWQYTHNWPVVAHMNELQETQLVNVSYAGFLLSQLFMNLPGAVVWLTGLIALLFFKSEKNYRVLALIWLFTLLTILLFRGKSYYTLGLYPMLFAVGGYVIDKYFKPQWKYGIVTLVVLLSLTLIPFSLPVLSHEQMAAYSQPTAEFTNRWEDGKVHNLPQDYADMTGWSSLAQLTIDTYKELPEISREKCVIFADEYGYAGAIMFYGEKHGLPEPICLDDTFLFWAPDHIDPEVVIYVGEEIGEAENLFEEVRIKGRVSNPYFREDGVKVYLCMQPQVSLRSFYAHTVATLKGR
ncbi:glycosyltransferase family 39 protein [Salinivirga cyanobacteriivorans]